MININETNKNFLTYGSIISFMLDKSQTNTSPIFHDLDEEIKNNINLDEIKEPKKEEDFFTTSEFLYSQGVFNEYSFFYNFKNNTDIKYNYYNSLFLVLPKGEFDALSKLRNLKRQLKNEYIIDNDMDIDHQQILDTYYKFKQEIYTNQKNSIKILTNKGNYINFNDCVRFMHIKSGKFLEYKQDPKTLKIYICLTDTPSENTIFRFIPAFNYQGENSAKVMNNLILKIACGGNKISGDNEKFISKKEKRNMNHSIKKSLKEVQNQVANFKLSTFSFGKAIALDAIRKVKDDKNKTFVKANNARVSLKNIVNDNDAQDIIKNNFKSYINISNIPYKGFGKNIIPDDDVSVTVGNKIYNFWRLMIFSLNFFEDNKYINSLDYFCIQNNERNLFIQAIDSKSIFKDKTNLSILESMTQIKEEDSLNDIDNNNIINNNNNNIFKRLSAKFKQKSSSSTIKLNYFYDNDFRANLNYELFVDQYEENDYIEPLGLFKFELVYNYGKYGEYEINREHKIDLLKDQGYVRLINIFTNKVLMVDAKVTPIGNIYSLKLVNDSNLNEKQFYQSIFVVEKVKDLEDLLLDENDDANQENNKINKNNNESEKSKKKKINEKYINKNDYIKIKSKKYNLYLGIRLKNDTNKRSFILTNTMSDLTKFKLNFLDDIDKYELHFFEQLLWSFNNIINYFIEEKDSFSANSISLETYSNYVKIEHILITLEKKINNFPEKNKVNISQKNKFDFMKVIEHFNIVSKLIDIFLANWFHEVKNLDYYKNEERLEKYFGSYEEKEELTLLRCKKIISNEIFKILKTIYDLNQSYLNVLQDRLLYFLMFIGRDDKCTKFLIYLLNNNGTLIISLCPLFNNEFNDQNNDFIINNLYSQNSINTNQINTNTNNININNDINNNAQNNNKFTYIKHCLKRIMKTYNSIDFVKFKINFSSVILLFKILNCLILYNQKPFLQFYDEYFKDLGILNSRFNEAYPNYEQNSILVHFILKNNKIFVRKKKFFKKIGNEIEEEIYSPLTNHGLNNDEFEFDLSELISISKENDANKNYSAIILAKLVAVNLLFYSYLSLCDKEFKSYLKKVFNFDIVMNNYLKDENDSRNNLVQSIRSSMNNKINEFEITYDLKYSLTKLIICLYFRISFPFSGRMDLFHCLQPENNDIIFSNLNSSIIRTEKPKKIDENMLDGIYNYICKLLNDISLLNDAIQNYPFFVLEILESSKYVIRNLFVFKNQEDKIEKSINLMTLILLLFEKFFGLTLTKNILGRSKNSGNSLTSIINDDLNIDENFYLITDNSKLIFEKYRKKLENILRSKENITKKRLFKKILLILSSLKDGNKFFINIKDNEQRKKAFEQLNQYELSRILMELSTKGNVYEDNIIENILLMICKIFTEFLIYNENLEIEKVFLQINKFNVSRPKKGENQTEDEYYDLLINSIVKIKKEGEIESSNYLDKLKEHYLTYKKNEGQGFSQENTFSFFKYLKLIDNDEFRNKILDILYRQNSQKKIFYENITNIVLFETQIQFNKFIDIKNIFLELFNTVQNLNLIKRLDNKSFDLFNELEYHFDILIKLLIDEKTWRRNNKIFNIYGSSIYIDEENNNEINRGQNLNNIKNNFNDYLSSNQKGYFISDFSDESIFNGQQTLYNLGFIDLINQIFEYISWVVTIKEELKNELICLEKILISIYKLLVIFIYGNQKHQFIVREKLYIYICPLKLNIKSQDILLFIGYFLLNVVAFFESHEDFNQIQHLDEVINTINILKNLDWSKNKRIIPFYISTFKIIISFCSYEYFTYLYPVLQIINATLINEILNNNDTKDDILSVIKILEIIAEEQKNKTNDIRNIPILSLHEIIDSFLGMLNFIKPNNLKKYLKLFKIFVIVTNILYNHSSLYKNEFLINKKYKRNLTNILTQFCNSFEITDDMVFSNKTKNNAYLRNFNEFIGISLPKLYIILSSFGINDLNDENSLSCIIVLSNELYEKILLMPNINNKGEIFLTKNMDKEIDDIINNLGSKILYLFIIRKKVSIRWKLNMPKLIRRLMQRKNFINKLIIKDVLAEETFCYVWNKIRMKINNKEGLTNFQNLVKYEINQERMDYIKFMMDFFDSLIISNSSQQDNEDKYEKEEIFEPILSYFDTYIDSFKDSYAINFINYKDEIYFFYWTNIHLMRYKSESHKFIDNTNVYEFNKINLINNDLENQNIENEKEINYFDYSITPYNKEFFDNLNIVEITLKQFSSKNMGSNNYIYLLYIKFLNSYLDEISQEEQENFFKFFIKNEEIENIFYFIKTILDSLINEINFTISKSKKFSIFNLNKKREDKEYSANLFENDINKYELIIQFITKLTADNSNMEHIMKNYLLDQYNNNESFNFIVILSNILVNFTEDNSNRLYITKYYSLIIQIIDCLSKCCNGPSIEIQNCIVKKTKLLYFIRNILKTITYRQKRFNDSGLEIMPSYDKNYVEEMSENNDVASNNSNDKNINNELIVEECSNINLTREKLSFLKYKLLYLLNMLTLGRKKKDNIYELFYKVIDFDVLVCVLIETYKEILIEKESQAHYENLVFGEDMLQRMDKDFINNNDDNNENFIIFEIGTLTFIMINIYLENLTWIIDIQLLKEISLLNKELKEKRYHVEEKSIFDNMISFGKSVYRCFRALCIKCGNCLTVNIHEDFYLKNSFHCAYSFYYDYTPTIEIMSGEHIMKYYVKLSPICKCLTEEMKEDFHAKVDRASTKTKIEYLLTKVDYYHYILVHAKKRLELFRALPLLDLLINHYKFYRDIFMIIGFLQNVLIFCSLYRTNDDNMKVTEYSPDFDYDYGFLYKHKYIKITRNIFFGTSILQCILSCLILITYAFNNIPRFFFFEIPESTQNKYYQLSNQGEIFYNYNENPNSDEYCVVDYEKKRKNIKLYQKILPFFCNLIKDGMLFYHLFLFIICLVTVITQNYRYLSILVFEIIMHSEMLKDIVKAFWIPRKSLILTFILFYLIAYYFFILVYLFIPHHVPTKDCFIFSDCYFTLCDQSIKNSNGIINYLIEEGLYISKTLYSNPRFWIDNWFAIIDIMLVLQMACSIIINSYIFLRQAQRKIEKDKNNNCFICGLKKHELNKLYSHEEGFYEHIKLDHYLWNYIFTIFSLMKKNPKDLISVDKNILKNYKKGIYSAWIPYNKCCKKNENKGIYGENQNEDSNDEE